MNDVTKLPNEAIDSNVLQAFPYDGRAEGAPSLGRPAAFVALVATIPVAQDGSVVSVLAGGLPALGEQEMRLVTAASQLLAEAISLHRRSAEEREAIDATIVEATAVSVADVPKEVHVKYFEADDSVLVDNEYVIRGVAGKILWLLLGLRESEGRSTFLNRELRAHPFLKLGAFKDNLEARLLNLQRRLEEKNLPIRLRRDTRGRVRLECPVRMKLELIPTAEQKKAS